MPFVLSIDPGGSSGEVRGWLESTATVVFDASFLPRFVRSDPLGSDQPDAELMMWWSIAGIDSRTLWMYSNSASTEIAHVHVNDVAEVDDASSLSYATWDGGLASVGEVQLHEVVVLHHVPTDRYLAVQVFDMYGYEGSEFDRSRCAAIDARWFVAPTGTSDFSVFR